MVEGPCVGMAGAIERLVVDHVGFVTHVAKGFRGRGVPLEDLVGEGCVGLLRAAVRYDPSLGIRFTTYAGYWVRKSILAALEAQPRVVRVPRYARCRRGTATREISIDAPVRGFAGLPLSDVLPDRRADSPAVRVVAENAAERLRCVLAKLSPRERLVLALRYGLRDGRAFTLAQVGERLGLSRERVRQIERAAIRRLRREFAQAPPRGPSRATSARRAERTASSGSNTGSRSYCS